MDSNAHLRIRKYRPSIHFHIATPPKSYISPTIIRDNADVYTWRKMTLCWVTFDCTL